MRLSDLDSKMNKPSVVLLQTPSTRLTMFIKDKLKYKYGCKTESVIDIQTKSDLKRIKEVMNVVPPFSERWFIEIDLDKLSFKDIVPIIKESSTCIYLCLCSKYTIFKSVKDALKGYNGVFDYYINYLRKPDFIYLYDAFVRSDNKLSKQLFDYVVQSYSSDIEAIFELLLALNNGTKFESRKDIAEVCGIGGLSVESFIFSMVKDISGSGRGLLTVIKNRVKAGTELGASLGYSSFYNFMAKSLFLLAELKMLKMSGTIYKHVRNLPDSFDEKALSRYQKYLWRLNEVPLSKLLKIRQAMGRRVWQNELDFLNFVYKFYDREAKNFINHKECE